MPDVFSWILNEYNQKAKPTWQENQNLIGDASLIVVAGRYVIGHTPSTYTSTEAMSHVPNSLALVTRQLQL